MRVFCKVIGLISTLSLTAGCIHGSTAEEPATSASPSFGRYQVTTIPFDPAVSVGSATYTPSGKVLLSSGGPEGVGGGADSGHHVTLSTVDDDGTNLREFFSQTLPLRRKDNGVRYMVFPDNRRIFLGDFVIECATSLETCEDPALLPVEYPAQVASGDHILHRWSEIIVAPDNRSIAWTTLLSNYSALVFTGALERTGAGYRIVNPQIVSTLDPFVPDPEHPDGVIPQTIRGGEVKQFVHGGTAIALAGGINRDIPDSTVLHLPTGRMEAITDTPGYTETTIFSPDEQLGVVMTTRFSDTTDPAILGLMPRPYPDSLNMSLAMLAYTYAVTGVRTVRPGNIGPALIDISASKAPSLYRGLNLNTHPEWVFRSPMSWHPDGTRALWPEGRRGTSERRIQVLRLLDRQPTAAVASQQTPLSVPYATSDLSEVEEYARASQDIDVKVYGRASGYITYRRTPDRSIEKIYVDFSDDGRHVYSGSERMEADPLGRSTYVADVRLTGPNPGVMDLKMTFGPIPGSPPAQIIFGPDASGRPLTHGYVEYDGKRLEAADLIP